MMFEAGDDAGSAEVYGQLLQSQANPDESDIVGLRYLKLGLADCIVEDSCSRRWRDRGSDLLCTSARVAGAHSIPEQGVRRIRNKRTILMKRCRTAVGPCHIQLDAPEATDASRVNGCNDDCHRAQRPFPFHHVSDGGVVGDRNGCIKQAASSGRECHLKILGNAVTGTTGGINDVTVRRIHWHDSLLLCSESFIRTLKLKIASASHELIHFSR
jgi:hypothetical protein